MQKKKEKMKCTFVLNHEEQLRKLNEKIDQITLNLAATKYKLGDLKRNNLDTYAFVQKINVL